MELRYISFGCTRVPWDIPWNSFEHLCHLKWRPHNSMESHGTRRFFIWRHQSSMEFHGIFYGIPWNTCVIWNGIFHGIPWNICVIWKGAGISWNSMIFHLAVPECHGIPWNISWNSMEHLCHLKWRPPNFMESHGTRWFYIWRLESSTEFHGISNNNNNNSLFSRKLQIDAHVTYKEIICKHSIQM